MDTTNEWSIELQILQDMKDPNKLSQITVFLHAPYVGNFINIVKSAPISEGEAVYCLAQMVDHIPVEIPIKTCLVYWNDVRFHFLESFINDAINPFSAKEKAAATANSNRPRKTSNAPKSPKV